MRQRYIQHPETLKLIPADEYLPPHVEATMIMPDIQPYQSMQTGEMIMGRAQHRAHLRQHNLIEIGTDTSHMKPKPPPKDSSLRNLLIDVVRSYS